MRPEFVVNCAMSADGKIAGVERKQVKISDEEDFARVHQLRSRCDAVIVGVGTVIADDPSLLVKDKYVDNPSQPLRIVLDPTGRTPEDALVLDGTVKTLVVTTSGCERKIEVIICGDAAIDLKKLAAILGEKGIKKVLVEGGGETIWNFFEQELVDRFNVFIGSVIIGGKGAPTPVDGAGFGMANHVKLNFKSAVKTTGGITLEYDVVKE